MKTDSRLEQHRLHIEPMQGDWPAQRVPLSGGDGFDYEAKTWGGHEVRLSPSYLGALRLEYCLQDLVGLQGKVLEVGCGAGAMAKAIKAYRPDLEVYGCDISHEAIRVARATPQGVTFEVASAYDLPLRAERFAAVVMFDVLEHLESPARAIEAIWRILEPGGLFHLFVPCEGAIYTLHGLLSRAGWRAKEHYGGHIQRLTSQQVRSVLEESGLRPVKERWSGHMMNQLVDVSYFSWLSARGINVPTSIEGYLEVARPSLLRSAVWLVKAVVAVTSYYESRLLRTVPGSGVHLLAEKRGLRG